MISEQDKQAILNGAYGVTREGNKVKWLFTSNTNSDECRHLFIEYIQEEYRKNTNCTLWLTENFTFRLNEEDSSDIVGLWKDKPEPFDLKRALDGESLLDLRNNEKCWLYKSHKNGDLITEYENTHSHLENIEPLKYLRNDLNLSKCFGMWRDSEPETKTVTLTLPCPLKEPKEEMWCIYYGCVVKSSNEKDTLQQVKENAQFKQGYYFGSEEDAQAWLDAMRNNRR